MKYICNKCDKEFHQKSNYEYHISRKRPCIKNEIIIIDKLYDEILTNSQKDKIVHKIIEIPKNERIYKCTGCDKIFARKYCLDRHLLGTCKKIKKIDIKLLNNNFLILKEETEQLKEKDKVKTRIIKTLESKLKDKNITNNEICINKKLDNIVNIIDHNEPINDKLINIIVDQKNTIKNLVDKKDSIINEIIEKETKQEIIEPSSIILNNVIIISRTKDNYINITQLCQAGDKKFNDWYRLENTNNIINELSFKAGIATLELIEINKENSWIHPKLAIQLAKWISPTFALQVSDWILDLFTNSKIEINIKLLKDKEREIQTKDLRIQQLKDTYLKKHKRKDYPEKNVIYILTTEDHKKNRIYIIGKANNLKTRLSSYNKTLDHEVIYYKSCSSEEDMHVIELMVLNKLKRYKEVANHDRFVLPLEKDISFFTNIIEESIQFLVSNNI
jgi:hypothetical protein